METILINSYKNKFFSFCFWNYYFNRKIRVSIEIERIFASSDIIIEFFKRKKWGTMVTKKKRM